jgi:hypothetical protein
VKTITVIIAPVALLGAWYLWYYRALSTDQRAELRQSAEIQAALTPRRRRGPVVKRLLGIFIGGAVLFMGVNRLGEAWKARHPAVKEHLAELTQVAALRLDCPQDRVTIVPENPMRARAAGCGKNVTFFWERIRTRGGPPVWHEIDPNCTFDLMGWVRPCH